MEKIFRPAMHMYEVWKVCEVRRNTDYPSCDIGTAFSMFITDVRLGSAHKDNTGNVLPDFDFAAAGAAWNAMTGDEQTAALEEAGLVRRKLYGPLCDLYPNQEAMIKATEDFLAAEAAKEEEATEEATEEAE